VAGSPVLSKPLLASLKQAMSGYKDKLFINCMVAPQEIYENYEKEGFLCIEDPTRAVVAMSALMFFGEKFNEKLRLNSFDAAKYKVNIPDKNLNEIDCSEVLLSSGLPVLKPFLIKDIDELSSYFKESKNKYVMKIVSSDIQHKTDVGGVVLNIDNLEMARSSYQNIFKNVKNTVPNAKIDGIMISPMKKGDLECILGAKIDPVFGPIVMFGLGGIYAEVMKDIVFAEAPVNKEKAEQMILSLKSKDIFYGARGKPPVNINSLLNAIVNLSNFIAANSDKVDQVEMNPILVSETEVIALDALIIKK
jgi:acyl-CoA synthetase (NDP forming)